MKDWVGNGNSVFKTLGASNHTDANRATDDYYATSPKAIDLLLKKVELPHIVVEPACGEGHLSERLKEKGHDVYSYDIVDRGYGEKRDFFSFNNPIVSDKYAIVTNPPYKYALEFILHSLAIVKEGGVICMFLKTTFLEGKKRWRDLFSKTPPKMVLQCIERVYCAKNGDFEYMRKYVGNAVSYAWFVWEKGYKGPTTIDWI